MATKLRIAGAVILVLLAAVVALIGQPSAADKVAFRAAELDKQLDERKVQIDPGDLLRLMYDTKVPLVMLDVRDEPDYNLFHLVDSRHIALSGIDSALIKAPGEKAVFVVIGNDEQRASEGWKLLTAQGATNAYLLAGGINLWLDVFANGQLTKPIDPSASGDDTLRHRFNSAVGQLHPAARPPIDAAAGREFVELVEIKEPGPKVKGGCG
ncbi:rhodanese-like domain-containing protein [bacterium]|nr:rhodanese-like domain-containing protein [bacterium]